MSIGGLVITFNNDADQRLAVLAALERHPAIEVGEVSGHRLPIVVETADSDAGRAVWDWLHALEGVQFVDLAFLHFEDGDERQAARTTGPSNASCSPSEKDFRS